MHDLRILFAVLCCTLMPHLATGQTIQYLEYFIDEDPGLGAGTSVPITPGAALDESFLVDVSAISPGFHTVYFRVRDSNQQWSLAEIRPFLKVALTPPPNTPTIEYLEYFIDEDPGLGAGTSVPITPGAALDEALTLDVSAILPGFHTMYFRVRDSNQQWSMAEIRPFLKVVLADSSTAPTIEYAEYFIDNDPGLGAGTSVPITAGQMLDESFTVDLDTTSAGFHTVYLRVRDSNQQWSMIERRPFLKVAVDNQVQEITYMEYALDSDPGVGNGTPIPIIPGTAVDTVFTVTISDGEDDPEQIYIRARDAAGRWSLTHIGPIEPPLPGAPQITSQAVTSALQGQPYTYDVEAMGNAPITFRLTEGPGGMTIGPTTGLIEWTPSTDRDEQVTVEALNLVDTTAQTFTIVVEEPPPSAPAFTSSPVLSARVGQSYQYTIQVTGWPPPTVALATAPNGMTLFSRTLDWTPTSPGRFNVTVTATNSEPPPANQSFTINVVEASFQASQSVFFNDFTQATSYRLLSVPGNTPINVASTLQGSAGTDWNVFLDNGADANFFESYLSGDDRFRFTPGRGFWVLSRSSWAVNQSVQPVDLDENGHFALEMQSGWNIIGSPFPTRLSWEEVRSASGLEDTATIFSYNGQGFQMEPFLEPYTAYYYDSNGQALMMPNPLFQASKQPEQPPTLPSLNLHASNTNGMQAYARIVLHEDAAMGQTPWMCGHHEITSPP